MDIIEFYAQTENALLFICRGGEIIHANREALFHKTLAFEDMENNKCCIINFDKPTFKTFLNVLMGYEDLTQAKALDIFPVVMKYNTLQLLINCVTVLQPSEMNEETIQALNLAAEFTCDDLINSCLKCISSSYGIEKLFQEENFYSLLKPKAVLLLVRSAEISFILLQGIKAWGNYYLQKNNINENLYSFLKKQHIASFLSLEKLTSANLVLNLFDQDDSKNLFPAPSFLCYLQELSNCKLNSNWEQISSQIICEHFTTHFPVFITTSVLFEIILNPIIVDDVMTVNKDLLKYLIPDLTVHGFVISQACFGQKSACNETAIFSNLSFSPKLSIYFFFKPNYSFYIESVTIKYRFVNDKCKILKMDFQKSQGIFDLPGVRMTYFTQDIIVTKGMDMIRNK